MWKNASQWNGTRPVSQTDGVIKKYSNLMKLEAGLAQARAAIKEGNNGDELIKDSDYIPNGPIYKNATAFYRYISSDFF